MNPSTIASVLVRVCIFAASIGSAGAEDPEQAASAMPAVLTSAMPSATAHPAITRITLSSSELPVGVTAAAPALTAAPRELSVHRAPAHSRQMERDIATLKAAHAAMRESDAARQPRLAALR
jgi:Cu/Zn superoxide dismutase